MTKGVLHHRPDSEYDDVPESQYQFPPRYRKVAEDLVGDWIVYYEPKKFAGRAGYNAVARIRDIIPDPSVSDMFVARIEPGSFLPLSRFVPRDEFDRPIESCLRNDDGSLNRGKIQQAMRRLPERDFARIIELGLGQDDDILPRTDDPDLAPDAPGLSEDMDPFIYDGERLIVEQTINRKVRNRVFRQHVLEAYDNRCALSGLKLINGMGRAEVEAAHIQPVAENGPDSVRNGLALSGTLHWMFDRGLISLSDAGKILISRQVNNKDEVLRLVTPDLMMVGPKEPHQKPHSRYLEWHRDHRFKT